MFGRSSYAIVRRCKSSIFSVAIQSAVEVSASSQTRRCSSEVPLDAARCRHSVHWREGGSARRCASRGMTCAAHGAKEGKDGRRRWCHWQRRAFPRRPSFPFPSSGGARHSAADDRRWRNPILASERSRGGGIPADDRCVMHGVDTTGTPAQVRCQKPAPPGAKAR